MYKPLSHTTIESAVNNYFKQVGISTCISLSVWMHKHNKKPTIEYVLSTITDSCKISEQKYFKSFVEMLNFINDRARRKEILFRKF